MVHWFPTFEGTFRTETSGTYPETYNPSPYSLPPLRLNPMKPFVANSKGRFTFLVSALFSKWEECWSIRLPPLLLLACQSRTQDDWQHVKRTVKLQWASHLTAHFTFTVSIDKLEVFIKFKTCIFINTVWQTTGFINYTQFLEPVWPGTKWMINIILFWGSHDK